MINMARRKISELESATDVTASDLIQIVDVEDGDMAPSGTNKKATAQLFANELGKLTNVTATGSTTARSLANRFADVVNVKDFGAKGDGVTDDTAAIQAAIDRVNSLGGGTVFIPEPSVFYVCSQTFTIGSNTAIVGDDAKSTLKWVSYPNLTLSYPGQTSGGGRRAFVNKDYTGGNSNIKIENIKIDFSVLVAATPGGSRQCVYFYNCNETVFNNCEVLSDGAAICNVRTTNYRVTNIRFEQVGTFSSSDGVIDQWDGSQNGTIENNTIIGKNLSEWPILVTATDTIGNPSIRPCQNFIISNNRITNAKYAAISLIGRIDGCFDSIIENNIIYGNLSSTYLYGAIDIRGCHNVHIANNFIRNTTKCGIIVASEGAPGFYPYQDNFNITIIGNLLQNCVASGVADTNVIEFNGSDSDCVTVTGNIIRDGNYKWAIVKGGGVNVTNCEVSGNLFLPGSSGVTNSPEVFTNMVLPIGTASQPVSDNGFHALLQSNTTANMGNSYVNCNLGRWSNDINGPYLNFYKSRSSTVGGNGIVQNNDVLSYVQFLGDTGSGPAEAARIQVSVDGVPGVGDMPGRIEFATSPNGSDTAQTRMTIKNDGKIGIGTTAPAYQLELSTDSAAKPSTSTWTISSDERLKENIEAADLDICYNAVKSIPLKRYKWKDEIYSAEQVVDRSKIGWIAQDVQAVFPKAVNEHKFTYNRVEDEDGNVVSEDSIDDCLSLNSDQIYAALFGAVQKLMGEVESLQGRIAELEATP